MGSSEQEALARQLFALHEEALGEPHSWPDLKPEHREAWIQVAQFVEARNNEPMATESNPISRVELVKLEIEDI